MKHSSAEPRKHRRNKPLRACSWPGSAADLVERLLSHRARPATSTPARATRPRGLCCRSLRKSRNAERLHEPDTKVQRRGLSQPCVNLAAVLIGGCSPLCRDGCDLNSTALVSLLRLYQVAQRPLTRFTRGSTNSRMYNLPGWKIARGSPLTHSRTLTAGAREFICKIGALVAGDLCDIAWSPTRTRHSG